MTGFDRSPTSYGDPGFSRFIRRSFALGLGLSSRALARPIIGIANTYSELNSCHRGVRDLVDSVKRGVLLNGGLPLEFPTISLTEPFLAPTSMLFRNLMAMETEEMLRAQPLDGAVLIGGCDKTVPAQLMAMASADVPSLLVTTGPMETGRHRGIALGACTDCRRTWAQYRAGTLGETELAEYEQELVPTHGTCTVMGTASTMAIASEVLGMLLPTGAAIPATHAARQRFAEESGATVVDVVRAGIRPSDIMTPSAFRNALRVVAASGGSTNALIHLIAMAGRLNHSLSLAEIDRLSSEVPLIVNLKPTGEHHMAEFNGAGGVPRVMKELANLLELDARRLRGGTLGDELNAVPDDSWVDRDVIRAANAPLHADGGFAVLFGNLAPDGAVIKHHAASVELHKHVGPAVVFHSLEDLSARIDDPGLDVQPESILVLQNSGPKGAPGMPEAGALPIPRKLLDRGVRDMVRISDARMSGTAFGTIVLHVAPESAVGGPLALVRDGDLIELDVVRRLLELKVSEEELRRRGPGPVASPNGRGYRRLFLDHVLQANEGCDFDFLRGASS